MAMSQVWRLFLQALVGFRLAGAATISDVYPNRGSTEGGTYLVITGSGFMMPTQANPWDSQVVFVGSKICNILAHYTSGTQIVCITTPYDAVAQSSDYLTVSVQIFGGLGLAGYASKTRAFRYLYHDTPLFFWAREWAGTGGDTLQFAGNVYHGADTAGHYQIRVGDSGCATDEESLPLSFRRRGHRRKHVTCRLPEDELVVPGHYNLTVRVNSLDRQNGDCPNSMCFPFTQEQAGTSYGYGMAAIIQPEVSWSNGNLKNVWSGTIDLATAQAYHFTVYPQVNAIEPSVGSLFGGNNLTLHGSSFAPDLAANEVFVGGRRCEVLEASQHRLVCQVPAWGAAGIGDSSMRGLRYTRHDIRRRRRWTRWTISEMPPEAERPVDEAGFVKGFLNEIGTTQPWDYRVGKEQSMLELTGFFVPPLTANYSFYMCGDDQLSLELGDEHGDLDSLQPLARMEEWISTSDYALVSPFCWYFREDLSSGDFTGPRKKVSEPMRLSAGSRSPFRLRHIGYGGPNWLRMGLKVSGLSVALGEDEELLDAAKVSGMTKISPAMELQALRLSGIDVRREQHFIEIGNTTVNDSFKLRIFGAGGHQALLSFHHGVHRNTIRNEVRNAKVVLAGQAPFALHGCRSITVDTVPLVVAPKVRYLLTFHCALEAESAQWIDMELVEARGGNVTVGKLQNASAPVSGTFRVGHGGSWTGDLDAQKMSSRWWELAAAISSLRRPSEDRGGELELECWRFPSGWMAREGFQVLVRFRRPIGDVAPLEVQTTGFPAEFRLEAFTIEDGDADAIFLEKIPADMFQVPFPDPESETLQVVTEGIVGAFGGSEVLGYQYSHDLVPAVSSAQPTYVNATDHLTLVISGLQQNSSDGWVDDLQILIGDDAGLCGDLQEVQDSDNESGVEPGITVMCKLSDAAAGEHQLHLISVSQGRANPDAAPVISVDLVLEDFQPHFGSLAGGTLLRLSGSGVRNLRCSDVLVGGRQCSKPLEGSAPATSDKAANLEASLFCLTPPSASFDAADASTWVDAAMPVTIAQPPRSASLVRGNFVYKFGSTPIVQAVSPAVKSAAVSAKFLLQGSNLESNDDEVALVRFGPREAKVIAQTSSSLEVWLQRAAPEAPAEPVFEPSVWMSKKGFAAVVPGTVLESRFEVTSVGPLRASKAGGVVLAIAGAGFHPESAKHLISLSPADGAPALECLVIAGNSTHLDCRLQGSAAKIVAQQLPSTPATEESGAGPMRRLSAKRPAPSRPLQCQAGGDDRSKVRCFAKALANAGSVRSQPSETASGRVSEALDFLRRVEADDLAMEVGDYEDAVAMEGGYGDREVYGDGYDGYGDQYGPAADLENGADEASRRLGDSRLSVPIEIQIRPRWGVESDAAEDFRLAHIRPIRKRRSRQRDLPAVQLPRRLMSEDEDDELNDTSVDPNAAEETEVGSDDSDEPEDSDGSKQVASETISDDSDEPEDSDGSNQVASEDSQSSEMGSDDSDEPEDSDGAMPAASTTKPSTTKVVVPPILTVSEVLDLNNSALEDFDANASDVNASDESDNLTETEEDENVTNSSNSSDLDVPTFAEEEATEEAVDIDESFSLSLSLNGVRARCKAESGCGLVLSGQDTPLLTSVSPLNGSYADGVDVELTLFSAEEPEGVSVRFGEQLCPDVQIRNLTEEGSWWSLSLPLCTFEASNVPIYVHTTLGYALFASPFTGADFHFTQHLRLSSVYPLNGSFYGGTTITISGVGFGASPSMNLVTVGQVPCQVLSASYDEIRCLVPPAPEELQEEENRTKNITVRVITASQDLQPGLRGEYFFFSQGSSLPSFDGRGPDLVRVDPTLNFPRLRAAWEGLSVSDHFAVRWTGFLRIHRAGMYRFFVGSDDGSQVFINGEMVINHDRLHGFSERSSLDTMFQGESVHMLTVLFFEKTGDAGCVLKYQGPDTGGEKIVVPAAVLSHARYQESPTLFFTYDAPDAAPMLEQLLELADGLEIVLEGHNFGVSGSVAIGTASNPATNFQCQTLNWTDTRVTCARPELPSGVWQVRLFSDSYGWSNAAADGLWVGLHVASVEANGISVDADSDEEPWVLIMKFSDGEELGYESKLWENTELLNADSPEGVPVNAKYPAYLDLPFTHLRACVGSPHGHCVHHRFATPWASARELFSAGYVRDSTVDQAGFVQAFGASPSSYRTCPMLYPGFNVECPHRNKARWGFCANCASKTCRDEAEADAAVGIGLRGEGVHARGAGWTPLFASGAGSCSYSVDGSQNVWLWVANATAEEAASTGILHSGYGGGVNLTLRGSGFSSDPSHSRVSVCGEDCPVVESSGSHVTCRAPAMVNHALIESFPSAFPSVDLAEHASKFYTDRGELESQLSQLAFTSSVDRQIDLSSVGRRHGCWFGFELPPSKEAIITSVEFFPPTDPYRREKVRDTVFEVRSFSGNLTWEEIASVTETMDTGATIAQGWTSYTVSGSGPNGTAVGQAFRVRILPDACSSTGELMRGVRFRGILVNTGRPSACPIEVEGVSHPLASAGGGSAWTPAQLSYSLERTPIVSRLSPDRGSARGGTEVTLVGQGLQPLDAEGLPIDASGETAEIWLNSYPCEVDPLNSSDGFIRCTTTERQDGIKAPETKLWLSGRGFALTPSASEVAIFRYVDRWSDIRSWLESEPPVDGDSVIVPEGQAIMLDQDSPKLFLLMISGYFEFDRRDLALNATYIWIAGGSFMVGTEEAPFFHQATITLHGDRWETIELPVIGSKMLAVTNLGGLGTCARGPTKVRLSARGNHYVEPCPVKLVGRMEIHGKPGISWTRLSSTASAGSRFLQLEEAVDWEIDTEIVITPSDRHQDEVRKVADILEGGFTVELDRPLTFEHLGIWYHHEEIPTPTDLRAAVGRLTRNVKVQGDDASVELGNAYQFGVHVGAFVGGVMRIENTEITRSGQAANFGRYSSHWHVLSPHRTVDVADVAYLRNNSYHNTFQRAVVVHSSDFATVEHNVAYKTKGHSYFTEAGDEVFALYNHNLAVRPLQHPLLLDDDMDPAGFWLPGFTGWHRNNLAAGCHRGWRVRKIAGVAGGQTDLTFFNNSAHASGFGWHLKPPHAPPTLNVFQNFTAFRCDTGMFYYGTGNILHDDHRFIECGTGHFMNHLSNGLHTPPFYHNLVLVGNIAPEATTARSGLGIRGPKDNEYFFVSGLKAINYFESPVLRGCFETTCTMRFERATWWNSTQRTWSTPRQSGIFWDLDGTLTGYPNGFVSLDYEYNHFPGLCHHSDEHGNGLVCGAEDGSVRVRRLLVDRQEPWQLDGKDMLVQTSAGSDLVAYDNLKLRGWPVVVVEGEVFDMRVDDPNDFQRLSFQYSMRNYVVEEHGYLYTRALPRSEAIMVHVNFTDWRNHFDATEGLRLDRMPSTEDPFGSHSMMLWPDECAEFNLTEDSAELCGVYVNETGEDLKEEIDEQPEIDMVHGRLTASFSVQVIDTNGSYEAGPDTPTGQLRQEFIPRECPVLGCKRPDSADGDFNKIRRWSDPSGWPDGRLPAEMDNVVLPPEDNVLLDIETPVLHWLEIQGRLEFDREVNATLHAHSVKVWGVLEMGTVERPMPPNVKAEIVLWGDEQSITVIMVEGLFLVNKVVAVLGNVSAVGSPSTDSRSWSRLVDTAEPETSQLLVQGNQSSWPIGAALAISATEFPQPPATTETEVRRLAERPTYDPDSDTTLLSLDEPLTHRHFAGVVDDSAENVNWPRPRLAAAVALLEGRSNVVIRTGEEDTDHGGEVVVASSADGFWEGQALFRDVDFLGLGKHLYQAPALKFNFLGGHSNISRVENCVFSRSKSGAIEANYASVLELEGNVFHRTYRSAVWLRDTCKHDSIVLRRNIGIETLRHPEESTAWVRQFGAFFLEVRPKELVGNVAAGSTDTGFILRPQLRKCQQGISSTERLAPEDLNEAVATVTGVFILGGCEQDCNACAQISGFAIWKSAHTGVITVDQTANVRLDSLLLSDNHIGVALRFFRSRKDMSHRIFSHNVTVFGSTSASTCAASTDCRAYGAEDTLAAGCNSVIGGAYRRVGIMTHMINSLAKLCELGKPGNSCRPPTLPVKMCVMPWEHRIGTLGSRYSEAHWDGITFGHFSGSDCGKPSVAFTYNPTNIDASYPQFFSDVTWLPSVDIDARVYLGESSIRHNKVVMSGDLDGTNQIVLTDADGSLLSGAADGSLVTVYNPALAQQSCSEVGGSYYSCPNLPLRYLTWEAAGGPAHRVLSKFKAWRSSDRRATWSQGPMPAKGCIPDDPDQDRNWKIRPNDTYKLTMFTSPPKHHRLFWFNDNADEAIRLDIFLTQPFRLEVYVDGALLPEESFDTSQLDPPRLPELSDPHGSYAFDPHARRFYLVMKGGTFAGRPATTGGGYVLLRMLQVVQISMQLSVKLADFDGPNIVNNLATLLQIDTSRIKIVSVQTAAQVAGAGGRRLQADGVDLTFQIVEESSEPIPGEAENATSGNESDDSFDFSGDSLAKLTPLVQVLQNASETGALSQALNTGVVVRSIETTDPTLPAAVESTTTTSATATTTTTTTGTATSTTTSSTTVTVTDTSTQTSTRTTSHTTTTATTSITTQTGTTSRTATRTTTGTTSTFTQSTTTTLTATTVTTTPDVADGATWTATSTTSWSTTSATHTETTTWSTTRTVTSTTTYTATHTETTTWSTTHTVTDTTTYTATYTSTDTITDTTTGTATTTRTETTKTSTHTTSVSVTGSSTSSPSTADAETSTTAVATTAQASTAGASTSPSEVETFTSTWSDTSVSTSEELLLATSSNFSSNGSLSETLAPEGDLEGPQFAVAALIPAEPLDGVAFSVAIGSAAGVAFGVATVSALLIYRGWRTPPVRLDRVQPLTAVVPVAWEPARKLP